MPAVNEWIAREYFESLGFLVQQPTKYHVSSRKKKFDEEYDLLIVNPLAADGPFSSSMVWTSDDLRNVARGMVVVRGWHTERFSATALNDAIDIFTFTEEASLRAARRVIGDGPVARILCLSDLPASKEMEAEALQVLRDNHIDGVILFRTILLEMVKRIDANKNYEKSDLMQVLRILKNYDLLNDAQLDLFCMKKRKAARPEE